MKFFEYTIYGYVLYYLSILLHELFHYLAAFILKIRIEQLRIGDELYALRIGRVSLSPLLIFTSYVVVDTDVFKDMNKKSLIFFFMSGSIANLLLAILGFILMFKDIAMGNILLYLNVACLIFNLVPYIFYGNDMTKLIKFLKS